MFSIFETIFYLMCDSDKILYGEMVHCSLIVATKFGFISVIIRYLICSLLLLCLCKDSSFAINCGGQSITSSDGIVFENENETLGAASYYVTDTQKWAVSNVGRFVDSKNAEYTRNTLSPFTNTLDTELFQSARLSPGSLRYYGLGLENGNYTVKLLFGERDFANSPTFSGVGRRAFDIYVQVCS